MKTKKMKRWQALEPGDIVEIVAPASDSSSRDLRRAIRFVEEFGLTPKIPKGIFGNDVVCANTDVKRLSLIQKAILAKDSKAIWCLRGGYGSNRIIPGLARMKPPTESKLFIGYSDITSLHHFFNFFWQWPTIHGSMLEGLGRGEGGRRELADFRRLIYGRENHILFKNLTPMNTAARKSGVVHSQVVGGNLAVLIGTLGTPYQTHAKGKILMLEDIGERGYRVDRMLTHLRQSGYLDQVAAVIFGDFVGGEEDDSSYLWQEVQRRFAKESQFPVLKGLPSGHGAFQRPLPFFTPTELKLGRSPYLKVDSGAL